MANWDDIGCRAARSRRRGFTLIELVIVTSLLAAMALTVSPIFFRALGDTRAEHAAADFVAALKYAQGRAITDTAEYRVYLDIRESAYWLTRAPSVPEYPRVFERLTDRYEDEFVLPEVLRFDEVRAHRAESADTYYVTFFPNGATDVAAVTLVADTPARERFSVRATGASVESEGP